MIISRTPYRLPISGGGTDLDFFFKKKEAFFSTLSINQYVYVFLNERKIQKNYFIQTTKTEFKNKLSQIDHKLIRETLKFYKIKTPVHIGTYSTVPTKTGLGSSSAMVVGLINCINKFKNLRLTSLQIIKDAFKIERKICNFYGGWQDQIISQIGGFAKIKITKKEKLIINKVNINDKIEKIVKEKMLLVYTTQQRFSHTVSKAQKKNINNTIKCYENIKSLNTPIINSLRTFNFKNLGKLLDNHWNFKKSIGGKITNQKINNMYNFLIKKCGCAGGKLIGAGGGGFLLMVVNNKINTKKALKKNGYLYLEFVIDKDGSKII
tara:strand:+ start:2365 stop:3330 length:966 start_codon:yes stop_codon:yes gene_type:complete